ncbi:MAG: carbon-nitrogen hydrolase family protein [Cyanobacteria bacterium P01_F01_bin.150]
MKIALVQPKLVDDMAENLAKALCSMEESASNGASVICFPEIQLTPFFPQYPGIDATNYALDIDHKFIGQLREKCRDLKIVGFPNLYLQEGENRFDASPVIDADGSLLGISKMVHIVQAPCFYEQDYYTPSDSGFQVFDTSMGKIGVVICFDRHYPESIRACALKGAQLVIIPTANTKGEPLEMFEWELRVPAMQNGVFIAMCNRVGLEGDMDFCGESIVVDPNGDVVAKADDTDQILYAEVDFSMIDAARKARPFLELRRPDAYGVTDAVKS